MEKKFKRIPVFDIKIGELEKKYVNDCLDTSWLGQGAYTKGLEEKFSKFVECKHGILTTSGTTALHLACASIGLKQGDEVLVSTLTNMACAFSIDYCNSIPIPIDVDLDTWQLNPNLLEKKITNKTKAIMVVHLFGHPVDMDPILKIAKKYNLKIIEDCAESHGVDYKGRKVGSIGDVAAFSFFSNKTITCGEGGIVTTNSDEIGEKAKSLKNLAYGKINKFIHDDIGFNYRLPNISAAIGLAQLENISEVFKHKERIYNRYTENLTGVKGVVIPKVKDYAKYIMWVYNLSINSDYPISRDKLCEKLKEKNIDTRPCFTPINYQDHLIKKYNRFKKEDCPNANTLMETGFYLPSGNLIPNEDIDFVCEEIIKHSKK